MLSSILPFLFGAVSAISNPFTQQYERDLLVHAELVLVNGDYQTEGRRFSHGGIHSSWYADLLQILDGVATHQKSGSLIPSEKNSSEGWFERGRDFVFGGPRERRLYELGLWEEGCHRSYFADYHGRFHVKIRIRKSDLEAFNRWKKIGRNEKLLPISFPEKDLIIHFGEDLEGLLAKANIPYAPEKKNNLLVELWRENENRYALKIPQRDIADIESIRAVKEWPPFPWRVGPAREEVCRMIMTTLP